MPQQVKHHYLPQFYLKGFSNDGRIWMYKKSDIEKPLPCNIDTTACKKKLYYIDLDDSAESNMIEEWLATEVEGPAAKPLENILNSVMPEGVEREALSIFFATLLFRSPSNFNNDDYKWVNDKVKNAANNSDLFSKMVKIEFPDYSESKIQEMRESVLQGKIEKNLNKGIELNRFLMYSNTFSNLIHQLPWILLISNDDHQFFVTDNSFSVFNWRNSDHSIQSTILKSFFIIIPLSKNIALMIIDDDRLKNGNIFGVDNTIHNQNHQEFLTSSFINEIRKEIFLLSKEYIFVAERSKIMEDEFKTYLQK